MESKQTIQERFARMLTKLLHYASSNGIEWVMTELGRTVEKQQEYYRACKSKCDGIIKKSAHQRGLAVDLMVIKNGEALATGWQYEKLGLYWEELGGVWGHRWFEHGKTEFDDVYHFELSEK